MDRKAIRRERTEMAEREAELNSRAKMREAAAILLDCFSEAKHPRTVPARANAEVGITDAAKRYSELLSACWTDAR